MAGAGCAGAAGYTWGVEPHWVEVVWRDLPVEGLPEELAGLRLVQISDLHVGPKVDDDYLVASLQRVRRLQPDLLVVTGDALSFRPGRGGVQFEQLRDVLGHLPRGRLGTFAILGNHDYGVNWSDARVADRVARELERAGARVLRNECALVTGFDIVGIDDLWARRADPVGSLRRRTGSAALVLCHNPDALDELDWDGYRGWILAGHTHGGQCRLPFLLPPVLPVQNRRYAAGEVRLPDGRLVYVNRGLGHLERVRFNVRPEVTVFTLRVHDHKSAGPA
jgi:predicted MPP superfamily phosphohydrolase